jgi:hypothetical protein
MIFRRVSSGFKKSRRSIIGIFKGGKNVKAGEFDFEDEEDKFPFGIPDEGTPAVSVTYVTAEGELLQISEERRKSMVFSERNPNHLQVPSRKLKTKRTEPVKGILKCISLLKIKTNKDPEFRPSSESLTSEDNPDIPTDFANSLSANLTQLDNEISNENSQHPTPECPIRRAATAPATPTGRSTPKRGIQFSPRLEFHETWHSAEYDRRGEPATCNNLTVAIAQMIKEELNAFKLEEMEVHEVHPFVTELTN